MSQRTTLRPFQVMTAGDMSDDIISTPTILQSLTMVNYEIEWAGTSPEGMLSVEASNTCKVEPDGTVTGGSWKAIPLDLDGVQVTEIPITGNSGKGMIDIDGLAAYAVRLNYVSTSGTGNITATVVGKVA